MEPSNAFLLAFLGALTAIAVHAAVRVTIVLPLSRRLRARAVKVMISEIRPVTVAAHAPPVGHVYGDIFSALAPPSSVSYSELFFHAMEDLQIAALDATDAKDDPAADIELKRAAWAFRERTTERHRQGIREMAAFRRPPRPPG